MKTVLRESISENKDKSLEIFNLSLDYIIKDTVLVIKYLVPLNLLITVFRFLKQNLIKSIS